jgi:hypothetical protein
MPKELAEGYALIHVDKVAYSLQRALVDSDLGVVNRGRNREWLGVHSDLANVYMTALAHDISLHGAFQPVTETTVDHVAVGGWSVRQLTEALLPDTRSSESPQALDDPVSALAFIAIRGVVPKDVHAITAAQIVDVRQTYAAELRNFHDSLTAIAGDASLAAVTDPVAFQLHLTALYEDRLAPKLAELERDLRLFHLDMVPTWLSVKTTLPPALALLFGDIGLHDPGASRAGALALAVVGLRTSAAASAEAAVSQNPAAYLLRLKETLGPSDLRTEIRKAVRRVALKV